MMESGKVSHVYLVKFVMCTLVFRVYVTNLTKSKLIMKQSIVDVFQISSRFFLMMYNAKPMLLSLKKP